MGSFFVERDHPHRHVKEFWKIPQFDNSSPRATHYHGVVHVEGTETKREGMVRALNKWLSTILLSCFYVLVLYDPSATYFVMVSKTGSRDTLDNMYLLPDVGFGGNPRYQGGRCGQVPQPDCPVARIS